MPGNRLPRVMKHYCPTGRRNRDRLLRDFLIRETGTGQQVAQLHDRSDVYWTVHNCNNWRVKKRTRCHLIFYCTSYSLNMFQALLYPSSGARDYDVYRIGHIVLGFLYVGGEGGLGWSGIRVAGLSLQPVHHSSLTAPYLQPTANQERHDQCGNQQHSRELLMMGILVPETCWAYKKYSKISNGIYLVF